MKTYEKEYRKTMKEKGFAVIQFKKLDDLTYSLLIGKTATKRDKFTMVAFIEKDTLNIFPPMHENLPTVYDLAYTLEYWLNVARHHGLAKMKLATYHQARNMDEFNQKHLYSVNFNPWGDTYFDRFVVLSETMGFQKTEKNAYSWIVDTENLTTFWDTFKWIYTKLDAQKMKTPQLNVNYQTPIQPNEFMNIAFKWEGEENDFHLLYKEGTFFLQYLEEEIAFEENTFSVCLEGLLEKISEKRKLVNLLEPPITNLLELVKSFNVAPLQSAPLKRSCENIMSKFMELEYTNQEVEQEAVRIYNNRNYTIDVCCYQTRSNEYFIRFFEAYYLVLDMQYVDNVQVFQLLLFDNHEDLLQHYLNKTENQISRLLTEKGFFAC